MLGYLNATLDGITTVRASANQSLMTKEFDKHQDLFTSSYYMTISTTRAFGFILDMLSSSFVGVIILKFVFIDTGIYEKRLSNPVFCILFLPMKTLQAEPFLKGQVIPYIDV